MTRWLLISLLLTAWPCFGQRTPAQLDTEAQEAMAKGRAHQGVKALERLAGRQRLQPAQQLKLAQGYLRQGRLPQAQRQAQQLLNEKAQRSLPTQVGALQLLGDVAARQGDWQQAHTHYTAATARAKPSVGLQMRLERARWELGLETPTRPADPEPPQRDAP